ncbi:MAG: CehA/McbA family metallohydrolase [Candidatus Bathyarchaeia archaeon]
MQLKIDLHVHTCYSYDALITHEELLFYAKKHGLDGVAITDHDTTEGALKIAKKTDFLVVPSIEVSSLNGHIVGLNVRENIPKGLSVEETVDKIHEVGGIAVACHPKALFKGSLGENVNSKFDAVEVINASAFPFAYTVKRSRKLASTLRIAEVAGSDAHHGPEIGCAYTVVDAEASVEEVVKAIKKGLCQPFGKAIPLVMRLKREYLLFKRKFESEK